MAFMKIPAFLLMVSMAVLDMSAMTSGNPVSHRKAPHHHSCSEPTDLKDQLQALYSGPSLGQMHESFYMMPFLRDNAAREERRHNFSKAYLNSSALFSGSSECPKKEEILREGDPCPVYHSINTDPTRYPRLLMGAQCRCSSCKGISGAGGKSVRSKCQGVYYYVRVLRRLPHCVDHVYQYAPAWEKLQIGCACKLIPVVASN